MSETITDVTEPPELWQPISEGEGQEEVYTINMRASRWWQITNNMLYTLNTKMLLIRDPFSRIPQGWNDRNLIEEVLWSGMTCELCSFRVRNETPWVRHRRSEMHLANQQWIQFKTKNIENWASLTQQVISAISYSSKICHKLILNSSA